MTRILQIALLLASAGLAQATLYVTNWTTGWDSGNVVPDNNGSGWADTRTLDTAPAGVIQGISVTLDLVNGWNGDLYAYLVNSSGGFAVLLDRVGYTGSGYGYGTVGMNVVLTDGMPSIETTPVPTTGGLYSPDAGYAGSLNSFLGGTAAGTWMLFVSDLSGGGVTTVQGWGLQMDIVAVPEVETWIAAALAGAFGAFWVNRQIMISSKRDADKPDRRV
jgi:hypothetical protein